MRYLGLLLISAWLLVMVGGGKAQAASRCMTGDSNDPTTPFSPIDAWITLPAGANHWYAFRDEGDSTDIRVRMSVTPARGVGFRILTTAEMLVMQRGEPVAAVGAGTPLQALNNDLYWTGNFVQSGIYYVLVQSNFPSPLFNEGRGGLDDGSNGGAAAGTDGGVTSSYMLSIQGVGVSFPLLSFSKPLPPRADQRAICAESARPSPLPSPVATPTAVVSSPQAALPALGRSYQISADETHWYAFRDEGDDGTIEIRAAVTPEHCLTFALWTPDQLRLWQQGESFAPVGQGTANAVLKADLFWTGSFVKSGIYYIVVKRDPITTGSCTYQLRVTGDDVSLGPPPLPPSNNPAVD